MTIGSRERGQRVRTVGQGEPIRTHRQTSHMCQASPRFEGIILTLPLADILEDRAFSSRVGIREYRMAGTGAHELEHMTKTLNSVYGYFGGASGLICGWV